MVSADIVVLLFGPDFALQGSSNLIYELIVTNAGPSVSSNILVSDSLPSGLVFFSATSGGAFNNNRVTWPLITALPVGGVTNYFVTVIAPNVGTFTNIASALAATYDPDMTNNTGVLPDSQVPTTVATSQFSLFAGLPVFNPQTGLYEEQVIVTNISNVIVPAVRLLVGGLRTGVWLYNASGTNSDLRPYVQYNFPLNPYPQTNSTVTFTLEFLSQDRRSFTNSLEAVAVVPVVVTPPIGTVCAITNIFMENFTYGDESLVHVVIEFASIPGRVYTVVYSDDNMLTWVEAVPSITANANAVQWIDAGPPKTESMPASVTSRFYRVILSP